MNIDDMCISTSDIDSMAYNSIISFKLSSNKSYFDMLDIAIKLQPVSISNIYLISRQTWSRSDKQDWWYIPSVDFQEVDNLDNLVNNYSSKIGRYGNMSVSSSTCNKFNQYIKNGGFKTMKRRRYSLKVPAIPIPLRVRTTINSMLSRVQDAAIDYLTNTAKSALGKEYQFIKHRDGGNVIETITNKFIKKYDKQFEHHASLNSKNQGRLYNQMFITRLSEDTFMFVATGNKLGNIEERYFAYSEVDDTDMYIYIFGPGYKRFEKEIEHIIKRINNNRALGIYMIDSNSRKYGDEVKETLHILYSPMEPRNLETLYFSNNEAENVCNHIDRFNSNKEFYKQRQILYKTGILLYGEPGTGKSSFVKALATKYGRSIVNINVANLSSIDLNSLSQAINVDDQKSYIVLFEDIDTLFLNRTNDTIDKDDNNVVNKLLQFLDSNTSPTNVIFIATTNHIERLDDALLREGRFDLKIKVEPLNKLQAFEFGKSFMLDDDTIEELLDKIDNTSTEERIGVYNQSKLQAMFLSKIENKSLEDSMKLHCEEEKTEEVIVDIVKEEKPKVKKARKKNNATEK